MSDRRFPPGFRAHTKIESYFAQRHRKNGKLGYGFHMECARYTPLLRCGICDVLGPEPFVMMRMDLWSCSVVDMSSIGPSEGDVFPRVLCRYCCKVLRGLKRRRTALDELGYLARKLTREAQNHGKQDRKDARLASAGDRRCEVRGAVAGEGEGHGLACAPGHGIA